MLNIKLLLIHPPTILKPHQTPILQGPISDVVPSTPMLEMYPIGFVTIMSYLEERGHKVDIVNLALKLLNNPKFSIEEFARKIEADIVGLDFHWLPHAYGAIEVARIIKRERPDLPIIMGGFSATYFHRELMEKVKEIDFIMRGDTTEEPLNQLLEALEKEREKLENIPNLVWRKNRKIKINPLAHVPYSLDHTIINYKELAKKYIRKLASDDLLPYADFLQYPLMMVLPYKGCLNNCTTCGGSAFAYYHICKRRKLALKSPEKIVEELTYISELKVPAFIVGDLRMPGQKFFQKVIKEIEKEKIDIPVVFELFKPMKKEEIQQISKALSDFSFEITPESGIEEIRFAQGRYYTNKDLEKSIEETFKKGASRIDIYFSIGLPKQTKENVKETLKYMDYLAEKFNRKGKIHLFISPLLPFLDPGSLAYEYPEKYGYIKYTANLMDHYKLIEQSRNWTDLISYETKWLTKSELINLTYEAALHSVKIRQKLGMIKEDELEEIIAKIEKLKKKAVTEHLTKEEILSKILCKREELSWIKINRLKKIRYAVRTFIKTLLSD